MVAVEMSNTANLLWQRATSRTGHYLYKICLEATGYGLLDTSVVPLLTKFQTRVCRGCGVRQTFFSGRARVRHCLFGASAMMLCCLRCGGGYFDGSGSTGSVCIKFAGSCLGVTCFLKGRADAGCF